MAAVTICSDFGAQKNKVWDCFYCFPIYFLWSNGTAFIFYLSPQHTPAILWGFSFRLWNTKATTPSILAYYLDVKESTCNPGDSSLNPRSGRSPGEGIGYPLQYSWASLVAQVVKNLPAMQETWVLSLDWEDPLEEGIATHSSIRAWRIPMAENPGFSRPFF